VIYPLRHDHRVVLTGGETMKTNLRPVLSTDEILRRGRKPGISEEVLLVTAAILLVTALIVALVR
jgi:hypothetical protein